MCAVRSGEAAGSLKSQDTSRTSLLGCVTFPGDARPLGHAHRGVFQAGSEFCEEGRKGRRGGAAQMGVV